MQAMEAIETTFATTLPVTVFLYQPGQNPAEWRELDRGPGIIRFAPGEQGVVRARNIGNTELKKLVSEISACPAVTFLNLAENRKIDDEGLEILSVLKQLTGLNLSSCSITSTGMVHLKALSRLEHLNLDFCNRITDGGLRHLSKLNRLTYLALQGCVKITQNGVAKLERKTLTINR
jgi:hypothetical protein